MDLNAPLGMTPPPPRRRRVVLLVVGVLSAASVGALALVLALADPRGGRPYVVAAIPPPLPTPPRPIALDATPTGTVAATPRGTVPAAAAPAKDGVRSGSLEGGVMVYRGGGNGAAAPVAPPEPLVIDVTHALDDPLGKSRGGSTAGARSAGAAASQTGAPQVAIFVSGLGLDRGATRTAIDAMPGAVTLAFLPYGATVEADVEAAKAKGHEILLQLPMRNEAGGSPGPHALRPDAPADALKADLAWLLDRFSAYDGVANLLGAPVTADTGVMTQVLKTVGGRHLYYLDDGTSRQSVADTLAPDLGVGFVKTDLVLDATSDPAAVDANLDRLVAIAKRKGSAVGMASGLPEHLGRIARFAADLQGKGVTLVPVNALAHVGGSVQPTAVR